MNISRRAWMRYAKDLGEKFNELKSSWDEDNMTPQEVLNAWDLAYNTRKRMAKAYTRAGNERKSDYNWRLTTKNLLSRFNQKVKIKYGLECNFG